MHNILTIQDSASAFGSPFVDSVRTAVTEDTTDAIQVVFLRPSMDIEEGQKLLHSIGDMFHQIHGGDGNSVVLSNENKEWRN